MVKKVFCDRCGEELKGFENEDEFQDLFDKFDSKEFFGSKSPILKPHLCLSCEKGYSKIIKDTNRKIKEFLRK